MAKRNLKKFIREFRQNGLKWLLENPKNVEELLLLAAEYGDETIKEIIRQIQMEQMLLVRESFIKPDYRRLHSDIVLKVPMRIGKKGAKIVWLYLLIEHQSASDRLMPFRVIQYVIAIYDYQIRQWKKEHEENEVIKLQPVLPIVFYTGEKSWRSIGQLSDLIELGDKF